jgi:hypothetical protein
LTPTDDFDEAYVAVEEEDHFLPFVGGEAARIELCACAAKRCLGVAASAALDPWDAAQRAHIDVRFPEQVQGLDEATRVSLVLNSTSWSGGAISTDAGWLVILNPLHDHVRQRTTLAEELTHIVMGHPPSTIDPISGGRSYREACEEEAYAVGGAMLLPYSHLFWRVKRGTAQAAIATGYNVSERFVVYRINRCGLRRMYARASEQ